MNSIMSGEATPAQVAGFLVALRSKGETVDELVGLVEAMIANASPIEIAGRSWTSSEPAATSRTPSTSPPWPR